MKNNHPAPSDVVKDEYGQPIKVDHPLGKQQTEDQFFTDEFFDANEVMLDEWDHPLDSGDMGW